MKFEELIGPIVAAATILFFTGFFVGMGLGQANADSKWCSRMKDTTWGVCVEGWQEVKVIKDAL